MHIEKHFLKAPAVAWVPSPNKGSKFGAHLPDTIIIHYTAGADAASSIRTLTNPASKASAHVVVGRDGAITQLVPFDTVAWHAGQSAYGNRVGYNQYAIGIEVDNAGLLTKVGDGYQAWFGKTYPASEVVEAVHRNQLVKRYWHAYTAKQVAAVEALCQLLIQTYGIRSILGHEEVSPGRKIDPGPAFPLDELRERLLSDLLQQTATKVNTSTTSGRVNTALLNMRTEPSASAALAGPALKSGTELTVNEVQDGWCKVTVATTGWVAAKYVERM